MPLHKVTKPFNTDGRMDAKYYGLPWVEKDGVIYADVPQEFVESYIEAGRIYPLDADGKAPVKAEPASVVEEAVDPVAEAAEKTESAEEVVEGTTEKAVTKKASRKRGK